ncbi:MAG: hypothetical protein LBD75_00405 [Candidatus Peribacteria bacterium]|nr:hypothetical protein [Candidatus Peribacteria bacterium]
MVYLAGVIKNDSSYGTAGVGARTHNPGNVGNTGSSERNFSSRQEGLDAAAKVIKERIDAYKAAYPAETGIPPIKNLLENRGPDGKGFLPHQANYQKENPYRADNAPLGAYMTAQN